MLWRRPPSADPLDPYHPSVKVAHRAHPDVDVMGGNHKVRLPLGPTLPDWLPIEVLHYPIRTTRQLERKFTKIPVDGLVRPGRHWVQMAGELEEKGFDAVLGTMLVDDDALERGLARGSLTRDTRVRDALRAPSQVLGAMLVDDDALERGLAGGSLTRTLRRARAHGTGSDELIPASVDDDIALAREFGDLHPVASTPRLRHRLDGLEERVVAMKGATLEAMKVVLTLLVRDEVDVVDDFLRYHLDRGRRLRRRHRPPVGRRDDGHPRRLRARRARARDPRVERVVSPGRVGDAHGTARGDRLRRRLGGQRRRGRVLVAA